MSDPIPETPPPRLPRAIHWPRVRLYLWGIVLMVTLWICGTLVTIRTQPERFIDRILAQLPFPASVADVHWVNRRTLQLKDIKLGDFFYADSITVVASPMGLLRRHFAKIQVHGGQLFTKALYAEMDKHPSNGAASGIDWSIGQLEIKRGTVLFDAPTLDVSVPIRLGVRRALILRDLKFGKPDSSEAMTRERWESIENVNIVSPFDPVAPVLAFPLIRIRFTYSELWHHHLREVQLIRPVMFLGEDLFWFTNEFQKQRKAEPEVGVTAPWEVAHFDVQYGQLAINAFGQPVVQLPFFFKTSVDNIRLDQLDKISVKSVIAIERLDRDYPDYKVQLNNLRGRIYFSLPPGDTKANNIVNSIDIDEISWNEIPVTKVSTNVTFDPNGVYGKMSGTCEGGQLSGNFEFYYTKGFTWNVDLFANKVNCQPIAEKVGGKYLNLTGELNGKLAVQGKVTDIQNVKGELTLPGPGLLEIKSMDALLKSLPVDSKVIKDQVSRIAAETFRNYPYINGDVKIDYQPNNGVASLNLSSPNGARKFDIYWHPYESSGVAKANDNQ